MFKIDTTTMPANLKDKVRIPLIEEHAELLAEQGLKYSAKMADIAKDLTNDEKTLISFYAVTIAKKTDQHSTYAKLVGLAVYGFIANKNFELAEDFIRQETNPKFGGSLSVCNEIMKNLKYLERGFNMEKYDRDVGNFVCKAVKEMQEVEWIFLYELSIAGDFYERRERTANMSNSTSNTLFYVTKIFAVVLAVMFATNFIR